MAEDLTSTQEINNAKAAGANDPTWDNKDSDLSDISPLLSRDTEKDIADAHLEEELCEVLSLPYGHRIQKDCLKSVGDPPTRRSGMTGVLRFSRESDNQLLDSRIILPVSQPFPDYPVRCEYCGERARPSLDLTRVEEPEAVTQFCCAQHQQLWHMLVYQRCLVLATSDLWADTPTPLDNQPTTEWKELLFQVREQGEYSDKSLLREMERVYKDNSTHPPVEETYIPASKVLSYQLSTCAPGKGGWTVTPGPKTEQGLEIEEEEALVPFCNHKPFQFGISHHRDDAGFQQKHYSNGMTFLTVFPDGSAQLFYPSGLLALVVVVTEAKGRVCIVYDSYAPEQPIRALFQSDGRATCYHSNGNIWLNLDKSGGQCLDETGARVQRWRWSSLGLTFPLRPVFLSLNKILGVRVLGQEQVFVSFLSCGQQAKFSVGACCVQVECKSGWPAPGPSITKEELFLLAGKIGILLTIKRLHQCLNTPSSLQSLRIRFPPRHFTIIQRLLEVRDVVPMSDSERAFIHRCLQDCL